MAYKIWIAGILQEERRQTQHTVVGYMEDIGQKTQDGCRAT